MVDGSTDENRELRNTLFDASGTRGVYPLAFVALPGGAYRFVGTWETVQELNERHAEDDALRKAFVEVFPQGEGEEGKADEGKAPDASKPKAEEPLPPDWVQCTTKDGKVYYANRATKVRDCSGC